MKIRPVGWEKFQHYRNRRPPWIKLHRETINSFAWTRLHIASKALAPSLWILASEANDGAIEAEIPELSWRFGMTESEIVAGLKPLIDNGFFECDSVMLADCEHDASKVLAREYRVQSTEERGERDIYNNNPSKALTVPVAPLPEVLKRGRGPAKQDDPDFAEFWLQYPRKVGKGSARAAWVAATRKAAPEEILAGLSRVQWPADVQYIPHPTTWLRQERWGDEEPDNSLEARMGRATSAIDWSTFDD